MVPPSLPDHTRHDIATACVQEVIEAWKRDKHGRHPVVPQKDPLHSVLAFPFSAEGGRRMGEILPLPVKYEAGVGRWMTLSDGATPELVMTCMHAGHCTTAHVDNPALQASVFHLFGHKLWFLWKDTDKNRQALLLRTIPYDDIDVFWCWRHFEDVEVRFVRFTNPDPAHKRNRLCLRRLGERPTTLIFTCPSPAGTPSSRSRPLFIYLDTCAMSPRIRITYVR